MRIVLSGYLITDIPMEAAPSGGRYLRDRFPDRCFPSAADHPDPFFCRSFLHLMNLLISSRFIPVGCASSVSVAGTG
jgi:hypothetical protein